MSTLSTTQPKGYANTHTQVNRKVSSAASSIQTKLTIGQPNDSYEQEADRVADSVVNQPTPSPAAIQRKSAAFGQEKVPTPQMKSAKAIRQKPISLIQKHQEEELQTKPEGLAAGTAPANISDQIVRTRGGGNPLPPPIQRSMESGIGADFSKVRIHTDSRAQNLSAQLNAQAFTVGSDVFFNKGKYNPESQSGKHLLAHELTHTVQQGKSIQTRIQRGLTFDNKSKPNGYEFEAGKDLPLDVLKKTQGLTKDGSASIADLAQVQTFITGKSGTVNTYNRLFLAALLDPVNVTSFNAVVLAAGAKFTFPFSSITSARRQTIEDLNRPVDTSAIDAKSLEAKEALIFEGFEAFSKVLTERDVLIAQKITALAGNQHKASITEVLKFAASNNVDMQSMINAMVNAASDSTEGDRMAAAAAYAISEAAGTPMTGKLQSGTIKVDALSPAVFSKSFGAHVAAGYAPQAGGANGIKGDTLYIRSNIDINDLYDRSGVIHELDHAKRDGKESKTGALVPKEVRDLELTAYSAQALYMLKEIANAKAADQPKLAAQAVQVRHDVIMALLMVVVRTDLAKLKPALVQIMAVAAPPFKKTEAELNNLLTKPAQVFTNAALGTIDAVYKLTPPTKSTPGTQADMDGFAGESLLDWLFR